MLIVAWFLVSLGAGFTIGQAIREHRRRRRGLDQWSRYRGVMQLRASSPRRPLEPPAPRATR